MRRLLPYLPPLLLVTVALHQIVLAQTQGLNPWKGGGFGMFATRDHGGSRRLEVFAVTERGDERVAVPNHRYALALRARQLPSRANLERVAEAVARETDLPRDATALRVVIDRVRFDLESPRRRRTRWRESVFPLDREGA